MCFWNDIIKMDVNETSFVFRLNYSLQQGQSGIFEKIMRVFCKTNSITSDIL